MKPAICAIVIALVSMAAQATDYAIQTDKNTNLILTDEACDRDYSVGDGWKATMLQAQGRAVHAFSCWRHIGDKIYVLNVFDPRPPEWPIERGGGSYFKFVENSCQFHIPSVNFSGWFDGEMIMVQRSYKKRKPPWLASIYGDEHICWAITPSGLKAMFKPNVYSAFDAKESVVP